MEVSDDALLVTEKPTVSTYSGDSVKLRELRDVP